MKVSLLLLIATTVTAQPRQKLIVWTSGMDHDYQNGVLWLKTEAPDTAALAVSTSADAQYVAVQVAVTNRSAGGLDVLPGGFSLTLNQPQVMPLAHATPEGSSGVVPLQATTVKPGQELRGTVYFRQERACAAGGECRGLLTIPLGEIIFVFPVTHERGNRVVPAPVPTTARAATPTPAPARSPAPQASPQPVVRTGKQPRAWEFGKVLDSVAFKAFVENGAVIPILTIREKELALVSHDFAYIINDTRTQVNSNMTTTIVRAVANRHHGCRYIVGDDIRFYQDKAILHVIDVDGKECKAEVMRQERIRKSP
jgi:hypothetical protein